MRAFRWIVEVSVYASLCLISASANDTARANNQPGLLIQHEWNAVRDAKRSGHFQAVSAYRSKSGLALRSRPGESAELQFRGDIVNAGFYRVYAWWPIVAQSGSASVTVHHQKGTESVAVNQHLNGGQWQQLMLIELDSGPITLKVSTRRSMLWLDSVKLEFAGSTRPPLRFADRAISSIQTQEQVKLSLPTIDALGEVTYRLSKGDLPLGLTLNSRQGTLTGRAFAPGRYPFSIEARDQRHGRAVHNFELFVEEATPVNDSSTSWASRWQGHSKPEGLTTSSADVSGILTIIAGLPEGAWHLANTNQFSDVWTPAELRPLDKQGNPTPSKIIGAWSSFDWDSKRADLIIYGGGHANYSGNDVYRWRASTQQWERMSLPSEISKDSGGNYTAIDGVFNAPASAHTYDNSLYLRVADKFLTFGGAAYNNGDMYFFVDQFGSNRRTGPYLFDPEKSDPMKVGGTTGSHVQRVQPFPEILGANMWQNRDMWGYLSGTSKLPKRHVEGCTAYSEEFGKDVVYVGANHGTGTALNLYRYVINDVNSPNQDEWTLIGRWWNGAQAQTACAYDPEQKVLVRLSGTSKPFAYWNVNTAGLQNDDVLVVPTDLDGAFTSKYSSGQLVPKYCGLDFDPVRKQFAMWCGGSDVFLLKTPENLGPNGWTIEKGAMVANSVPATIYGTGILGKWKYIANLDVFIGLQDSNAGNVWIYKPEGWQQPIGGDNLKPVVSLTSPTEGQEFVAGDVVTLVADASDLDGTVSRVDFYRGATLIASDENAPFIHDWLDAPVGNHTLSALATDDMGAQSWSNAVPIAVLPGQSGTVTLQDGQAGYQGTRDTYLSAYSPSGIAGGQSQLYDENDQYAPMLRFTLFANEGGILPDGALIQNAQLHIYKANVYASTWGVHRMLRDWQEMEANWLQFRNGQAWSAGGANGANTDYVSTPDASTSTEWGSGWVVFDVTAGVQQMQSEQQNFGWRLIRSAGDRYNLKRFYSRDYTTDITRRPKLVITYAAP